ncbi:gamma-glutamyltranspeptidase / glutathione hydrolase [Parapedobacter composti]|uniref:Glutathione hydrolase proenzyme n=1 Tax=Parapedobacter composti TaxID=623281 RepID=A0A1I1GJ02_9SPHI|nr:gamma-glutamyltransferase [Parapedobacter composti]SFC11416.1 gamma-glutamyltranspeptidase / glutathione hydrolase [Parapedobacter composti]
MNRTTVLHRLLCLFVAVSLISCNTFKQRDKLPPAYRNGLVVTAHPEASAVGLQVLRDGGNAVDAAVAVQFALAVVYPNAGNIGGGGFMVYRTADGGFASLDFREAAPAAATRDMYLDAEGNPITELSLRGQLAAGVPGVVDGMVKAHERYGKLKWAALVEPAIRLAQQGFPITAMQARELNNRKESFKKHNPLGTALVKEEGEWAEGDTLIQTELAHTLTLIAENGRAGFYEGEVADRIVEEMARGNGIISHEDLKRYEAKWRQPVSSTYRGLRVVSMPPPSSGGIALIAMLKSVEAFPLARWGFQSDSTMRVMIEAERRVYADRATHLGDPDFYNVPQQVLIDSTYNAQRMSNMDFSRASLSSDIHAGSMPVAAEHEETTHFSIVDRQGNAVSLTTTINGSYGSHVVVAGAGFLLNNEMDDFSVKPGAPNMYGLVGGAANAIEPGKRMLSSMTPTIIEKDGKLYMVVGTPGGSTIMTSVFQTILNVVDFGMDMQQAVDAPRFHHQWLPDEVAAEKGAIGAEVRQALTESGYKLVDRSSIGRVDAILVLPDGGLQGGADPRGDDVAMGY